MKYLGNKNRLYDFLKEKMNLTDRSGQRCLDAFCGTGSVSYLFKSAGINTISNDLLYFPSCRTRAVLLDNSPRSIKNELESAILDGFITDNYSEKCGINIFKKDVASHVDGARVFLEENAKKFTIKEFSYYLSQIIEAADFRSNIMGSYESFYKKGWRKQCEYPWEVKEFELIDNKSSTSHEVYNGDWRDVLEKTKGDFDFIYLDPPYNSRQYSSVMHVLETIAVYDRPRVSGFIRKSETVKSKKSNFSSRTKCKEEFSELIKSCSKRTGELYLSYSNEGIVGEEEIMDILQDNFKNVVRYRQEYRRFKTNSKNENASKKVEEHLYYASR